MSGNGNTPPSKLAASLFPPRQCFPSLPAVDTTQGCRAPREDGDGSVGYAIVFPRLQISRARLPPPCDPCCENQISGDRTTLDTEAGGLSSANRQTLLLGHAVDKPQTGRMSWFGGGKKEPEPAPEPSFSADTSAFEGSTNFASGPRGGGAAAGMAEFQVT